MITAIVDLQFGSTGKGLIAGFLSQKNDYDLVVSANMPNAGHTFVDADGRAWVNKVLPSGVYSEKLRYICIGPGAVFDPRQLASEIRQLRERGVSATVLVHPTAGILLEEHRKQEAKNLSGISSTMQGSMAATVQKMSRNDTGVGSGELANIAQNYIPDILKAGAQIVEPAEWVAVMAEAKNVLVEGSQGYSLGLNAGFYPYCTSRDCTVWRLLADAGVVVPNINNHKPIHVIGTARVHPIRVGNTPNGYSGGCYPDQRELTWEELGQTPEKTTVTGRVRRVFSFSDMQIIEAMRANSVDEVFLNFCNYDPAQSFEIADRINRIGTDIKTREGGGLFAGSSTEERTVRYMGFGPSVKDVLVVGRYE